MLVSNTHVISTNNVFFGLSFPDPSLIDSSIAEDVIEAVRSVLFVNNFSKRTPQKKLMNLRHLDCLPDNLLSILRMYKYETIIIRAGIQNTNNR